ncbi:sulfite exporter TauE/SafE family protein [Micromonospora lupini]|uniref:sulfite exporter TauE/SafE family protein n=1 Tax=Micromonospora lupini TaxID=285679 RepID=UPI00225C302C|nr:sulfite exporter TauE/SafE family protein [Micromonospora lupini]MCX5067346.1 sulfite exporter TauE/SafE family protein [Micromonospora lupini]
MVRIPSLSRRSEPAPTRDENLDGRIDGRDTPVADRDSSTAVTDTDRSEDVTGRPVVTDRDADQTTYRSTTATDDQAGAAERRAAERAAVARAATARPLEGDSRPGAVRSADTPTPPASVAATAPTVDRTAERDTDVDRDRTTRRPERDTDLDRTTGRPDPTDRVVTDRPVDPTPGHTEPEPPVTRGPKPRASLLATLGLIVSVAGALFVLTGTLAGYGIGLGAFGAVLSVLGLMATRRRHVAGKTDALFGVLIGLAAVVIGVLAMTGQFDWPTTDGDWVPRFREWLDSQFVDRF